MFQHSPSAEVAAGLPLASLKRRFGALVVDWILCVLVASLFAPVKHLLWQPGLVLIVEYVFFVGLFGQTPGMRVARIRCVPSTGAGATGAVAGVIGVPRAALRALLLSLIVPGLLMDAHRRGLHDRAAGSVMVAEPGTSEPG